MKIPLGKPALGAEEKNALLRYYRCRFSRSLTKAIFQEYVVLSLQYLQKDGDYEL
jgi:hypothetical protein